MINLLLENYKLHDCDLEKIDYDEKSHTLTMQVTLDETIKNELKYNDSKIKIVFDNVKIISLDGDFNYLQNVEILNIKTKNSDNGSKIYDFFFVDYFAKQKEMPSLKWVQIVRQKSLTKILKNYSFYNKMIPI